MIAKIKIPLLAIITCTFFAGCTTVDVDDTLTILSGQQPKFRYKAPPLQLDSYRNLGSTITCTQVGNTIMQSYQLSKKKMSATDIYWKITPKNATYGQQDMYLTLIKMGLEDDGSTYTLYKQACDKYTETYQKAAEDVTKTLYGYVDLIYKTAYLAELEAHKKGLPYGETKNRVAQASVKAMETNPSGFLDKVSHDINIMIVEQTIRSIYPDHLMGKASQAMPMPSLNLVRKNMAPELVVNIKRN